LGRWSSAEGCRFRVRRVVDLESFKTATDDWRKIVRQWRSQKEIGRGREEWRRRYKYKYDDVLCQELLFCCVFVYFQQLRRS